MCECVPVGMGVCVAVTESCSGRRDAGVTNKKETDQEVQGVDAHCEVMRGKNTSKLSLNKHDTGL